MCKFRARMAGPASLYGNNRAPPSRTNKLQTFLAQGTTEQSARCLTRASNCTLIPGCPASEPDSNSSLPTLAWNLSTTTTRGQYSFNLPPLPLTGAAGEHVAAAGRVRDTAGRQGGRDDVHRQLRPRRPAAAQRGLVAAVQLPQPLSVVAAGPATTTCNPQQAVRGPVTTVQPSQLLGMEVIRLQPKDEHTLSVCVFGFKHAAALHMSM